MPETRLAVLAVGAALDWELRAVLRALGACRRARHGDLSIWRSTTAGQPIVLYRTGVGVDAATRRTAALLATGGIDVVINTGCAGGLRADLEVGAVVAADEMIGPLPAVARHRCHPTWRARLHRAAASAGLRPCEGALLTSPEPLLSAESKSRHRRTHGAAAVDMESAAVAALASAQSIPAASLRAILDTADTDLPPPAFLFPRRGQQRETDVVRVALADPRASLRLLRLRRAQRAAETALETVFRSFFQGLRDAPEPAE